MVLSEAIEAVLLWSDGDRITMRPFQNANPHYAIYKSVPRFLLPVPYLQMGLGFIKRFSVQDSGNI